MSWLGPSPRHCARATQLLLNKYRSGGEPLAPLSPVRDLNLRPPTREANALPAMFRSLFKKLVIFRRLYSI